MKLNPHRSLLLAVPVVALFALSAPARAEPVKPVATSLKANETAILLVDFQANFVSPDGAWYRKFAEHYAKGCQTTHYSWFLDIPLSFPNDTVGPAHRATFADGGPAVLYYDPTNPGALIGQKIRKQRGC